MEAQNIVSTSNANGLPVLLGNLDHLNSSWILRALGNESMGIANPHFCISTVKIHGFKHRPPMARGGDQVEQFH